MLIPFPVMTTAEEFLACRGRVAVARPTSCPTCGHHRLTFAGWWTRLTRHGPVDVHRVRCAGCEATHSLWPDLLVAGCGDLADTVGAVLEHAASGAGHRPVAARAGLAATTVRGWLRRFRRVARGVTRRLVGVALAAQPDLMLPVSRRPLTAAVNAVLGAATAISRFDGEPVAPWRLAVVHSGGRLLG